MLDIFIMNTREANNSQSIIGLMANQLFSITKYILANPKKLVLGLLIASPIRAIFARQDIDPISNSLSLEQVNLDAHMNQSLLIDDLLTCALDEKKVASLSPIMKVDEATFKKIEAAKKTHMKNIQDAFKKINIHIPLKIISKSFNSLQKMGATNIYLTIKFKDNEYIVRINGQMWPPYQRNYEQSVLPVLKDHGVETGVLFNNDQYQICQKYDDKMRLSSILESKSYEKIYKALQLSGKEIAKYQQFKITDAMIDSPLEKMFNNAITMLQKKFSQNYSDYFSDFQNNGQYFLNYISHNNKILSHNDLLPSSIFVDLSNSKINIVDWEYSALAYWSHDLSFLGCSLTNKQTLILANYYYSYQNKIFSDTSWLQLQANMYIHQFLKFAWKVNPENIFGLQFDLNALKEKNDLVEIIKAKKAKAVTTVSQYSLLKSGREKESFLDNNHRKRNINR